MGIAKICMAQRDKRGIEYIHSSRDANPEVKTRGRWGVWSWNRIHDHVPTLESSVEEEDPLALGGKKGGVGV